MGLIIFIGTLLLIIGVFWGGKYFNLLKTIEKSQDLSVKEALALASENGGTVSGVIINGKERKYFVYEGGKKTASDPVYSYEIGSLNKTLTAALFIKDHGGKGTGLSWLYHSWNTTFI